MKLFITVLMLFASSLTYANDFKLDGSIKAEDDKINDILHALKLSSEKMDSKINKRNCFFSFPGDTIDVVIELTKSKGEYKELRRYRVLNSLSYDSKNSLLKIESRASKNAEPEITIRAQLTEDQMSIVNFTYIKYGFSEQQVGTIDHPNTTLVRKEKPLGVLDCK